MKNDLLPFSSEHLGEMDILSNGVESSGDIESLCQREMGSQVLESQSSRKTQISYWEQQKIALQ